MYPCWIDITTDAAPLQQTVFEPEYLRSGAVLADLTPSQVASAEDAISAATEILFRLTGGQIHGPGVAVDEYNVYGNIRRLTTTFRPLRDVISVERISVPTETRSVFTTADWCIVGQSVQFSGRGPYGCGGLGGSERLRLTYRYGSTVTRGARATMLYYARQLYLAGPDGDIEKCQLPERVTSINREGMSLTAVDPQSFLDKGLTGLIKVDEWLASYAARKSSRPSAVYTPDSPPPVNIATWCNDTVPTTYASLEDLK